MDEVDAVARDLRAAYHGGPIAPVGARIGNDLALAYRVQARNVRAWCDAGRRRAGFKIGMTSVAARRQFGVDEPDFGVLFDDIGVPSGGEVAWARMFQPRVEGEIALRIGRDIDCAMAPQDAAHYVDAAIPALEIADSRIADWRIAIVDTVADNASAGLYVLGRPARDFDFARLIEATMTLRSGADIVSQGRGASTMGGPHLALAWLANALLAHGERLKAGDVVLSGALGPPVPATPGATYAAEISGLGFVSVSFGAATRGPGDAHRP